MFLRFAYIYLLYALLPLFIISIIVRFYVRRPLIYRYSRVGLLQREAGVTSSFKKYGIFFLRFISLLIMIFLIAKPQWVDPRSRTTVEGIDIVLALDVSGSMQLVDAIDQDSRTRFEIARHEAVRFVEKRENDQIGLVLFAGAVFSRCPLTHDHIMIKKILEDTNIGLLDHTATLLARGMATALNRLKDSKAKSKVIILLTDGEPSPGDFSVDEVLEIAKSLGVKIYTIGTGSIEEKMVFDPFRGLVSQPRVNVELLHHISQSTGARSFLAHNAHDMRSIYESIDALERVSIETPLFTRYIDIFIPFIILIMCLLLVELIVTSIVWFGL